MILIAESGSTKTDAVILDQAGEEVTRFCTMGFNPYFHQSGLIEKELRAVPEVAARGAGIRQVYFYGAGCSSPALNQVVRDGLQPVFSSAQIHVDHDLMASAYATYDGAPAITCILGTGSNSVFFDGRKIREEVPSLAFILGDEGSASYLGKQLITSYFYKKMPAAAARDFEQSYHLTKDEVINAVYARPHANVYLAGFAPFVGKHIQHPFFWEMVFSGFKKFLEVHVLCYPEARQVPVNFVGSVAFHFKDILQDALDHLDLSMGKVVQKPLEGLILYHKKYGPGASS